MSDHYVRNLILNYEQDILGNQYTFYLSNGEIIPLMITPENIPHLFGLRKLPLRQVQNTSAIKIYDKLKHEAITLEHIAPHKEAYMKIKGFEKLVPLLYCGNAMKVVKSIGALSSNYLFYLEDRNDRIIHLGVAFDGDNAWYPESVLVKQGQDKEKYIRNQEQVEILKMNVDHYD